jgi:hypothetical protein
VRRFYEEIDKGNLDAMDELVDEDYLDHNPPPFPGLASGREGLKQAFKIFWEATPGYHHIEEQKDYMDWEIVSAIHLALPKFEKYPPQAADG